MAILTLTLFALQAVAASLPEPNRLLHGRQDPSPAAAKCDNKKAVVEAVVKHERNNRQGSFLPRITMSIGNPAQEFTALLDTGSGELLVGKTGSKFCTVLGANCTSVANGGRGSINANASAALETVGPLSAHYFNGELNLGEFKKADLNIGSASVKALQFGLVDELREDFPGVHAPLAPLFGVGPVLGETPDTPTYPNLPARMVETGDTKSNIFGVYLNDFRGLDGSVVFGGVDAAKFTGELKEAPLVPVDGTNKTSRFQVEFSSLQLIDTDGNKKAVDLGSNGEAATGNATRANGAINLAPPEAMPPAFIDTGNPGILIAPSSVKIMAQTLGANITDGFLGPVDCKSLQGKSLRFGFNKDNAVVDLPLELTLVPRDISVVAEGLCETVVGFDASIDKFSLLSLGAPLMQAAYVAFDMERSRLLFAPAVMNATKSDLRELGPDWKGTVQGTGA
ncbi:hypothetical protein NLG97_g199 [Lecanicillium saksenae]|uniref:Uncharacterized protein n=1 Tax=Lecanicillium saksenae TaxID=468837 RepID=A0ACC1R752_9HYPO|nr:hypothetical protein NLG97_g199 [Lecanicillium saksenae]